MLCGGKVWDTINSFVVTLNNFQVQKGSTLQFSVTSDCKKHLFRYYSIIPCIAWVALFSYVYKNYEWFYYFLIVYVC